jgi:hypothetical protein
VRHGRTLPDHPGGPAGYEPKVTAGAFGDTIHWTNSDSITHTTTQNAPLSLWNSGRLNGGGSFSKAINVAGSYPYGCTIHSSMTGTIKVRIQVSPTSGSVGTIFTVAVASLAAPSGSVYDIQAEEGKWRLDGLEDRDQIEVRDVQAEGIGNVWSFRSRLRKTWNGAKSGWSPVRSNPVM